MKLVTLFRSKSLASIVRPFGGCQDWNFLTSAACSLGVAVSFNV